MRIAIDVRTVQAKRAGIGIYTQHLLGALAKVRQDEHFMLLGAADTAWNLLPGGPGFSHHAIAGGACWHLRAARLARGVDVYHSPSSIFVPMLLADRAILTVHDLVPFVMPEVSNAKTWWTHRAFKSAVRRVRGVIAVSQSTATDLVRVVPGIEAPVWVVHEAPRPEFAPGPCANGPDDYYLAVGTLEPRKNLLMLLRAYRKAAEHDPNLPKLVIAGKLGWKHAEFEKMTAEPWLRERVRLAGYVSDAELLGLFRGAVAFVYPSRYEGFGLPVLEAMACGTPVITSGVSSLPEVGGDAVWYVDPADEEGLSTRLLEVQSPSVRSELSRRGLERATGFSWEEAAHRTLEFYRARRRT